MNTKGLAKLYDRLTVWERLPLLIASRERGDETESRRLFDSAPLRTWCFQEHLLSELALNVLALIYIGEQLDHAANHFHALWRLEQVDDPTPETWCLSAEVHAYLFTMNADAWRRCCAEVGIDGQALSAGNHNGWFLGFCEENIPANAPTLEALQARFRECSFDVDRIITAADLLTDWRHVLDAMTRHAGRGMERRER